MESSVRLGKIWGIPIGLNSSWFLIFALVTWSLAVGYFPFDYPELTTGVSWVLAFTTSILFFGSVLLHELGHAFMALREKIGVRAINLFIFGGVAQIEGEPKTAGAEFRIAIAGPIVSLGLAAFFGALWLSSRDMAWLAAPAVWLARINLILAIFNMLPGFPLDGGRVLRAAVWQFTGNFQKANRFATTSGQLVAYGFMGLGVFIIFTGYLFNGLWLIFIGWFLQNAASSSYAQSTMQQTLRDLSVAQVMATDWPQVPCKTPLTYLIEEQIFRGGPRYAFLARDGYGYDEADRRPLGMISLTDISKLPQKQWPYTTADQVMIPWEKLVTVSATMDLLEALQIMDKANVAQVPVLDERGDIVGVLSREKVFHMIRIRSQLQI
jgi:Zn-dependent protease